MNVTAKSIAKQVISTLKRNGIVIQQLNATTGSVYLKFDYGMANSLRISDHSSPKVYLPYRYNILKSYTNEPMEALSLSGHSQFYFSWSDVDKLIDKILEDRAERKKNYGTKYAFYMNKSKDDHANKDGFWTRCREV
jgi:hypothetical protein